MILSAAVPAFYFNLRAKKTFKEVIWNGILTILIGTAAMFSVMIIHTIQLTLYFDSLKEAVLYLADRTEARGVTTIKHANSVQQVFLRWMKVKVFYFSKRFKILIPQFEIKEYSKWNNFGNFHWVSLIMVSIAMCLKSLQAFGVAFTKNHQGD